MDIQIGKAGQVLVLSGTELKWETVLDEEQAIKLLGLSSLEALYAISPNELPYHHPTVIDAPDPFSLFNDNRELEADEDEINHFLGKSEKQVYDPTKRIYFERDVERYSSQESSKTLVDKD